MSVLYIPVHNIRQQIVVFQFVVHRHLLEIDGQSSSVDTSLLENEAIKPFSCRKDRIYPFYNEIVNVKSLCGYTD